jgi:hypothetical protein
VAFTAVLLTMQVLLEVTLCPWAHSTDPLRRIEVRPSSESDTPKKYLDCFTMKIMALRPIEILETTFRRTQRHAPEDLQFLSRVLFPKRHNKPLILEKYMQRVF